MDNGIPQQPASPTGGRSSLHRWFTRLAPDAIIPLATPISARALQAMPKAPERVRIALQAAAWDGAWNRPLFRQVAKELNLPLPTVERHAEGLQNRFRTAATAAVPEPEERTQRTTMPPLNEDTPSPPAYTKPNGLTTVQSDVWDEIQKRELPLGVRMTWTTAEEIKRVIQVSSATTVWNAQEAICKKLRIPFQKNLSQRVRPDDQEPAPSPNSDAAAASAEPELEAKVETESQAATEGATGVDLQASLQAILSRADLDAEIERGGLVGGLEALVQRDRATRQELSVYQDVLAEQKSARERLETTLAYFRNSIAKVFTTPARSFDGASDNVLINGVLLTQRTLVDLQNRYQQALADRELLLGEVARAHEELDVADISRNALQSDPPQGEPDQLTLAQRINELVTREEKAVEGANQALQPTEPNLSTLVIRSLVTLSDRDSVHRAADLLERTVLQ
jgi:hypothetical protein